MSEDEGLDFNIVEAGIHDLEMLALLFDRYRIFYNQPSDLVLARRFMRARIEHRNSVIFLAVQPEEDGEKPLGFTLPYPSIHPVMSTSIDTPTTSSLLPATAPARHRDARHRRKAPSTGSSYRFR